MRNLLNRSCVAEAITKIVNKYSEDKIHAGMPQEEALNVVLRLLKKWEPFVDEEHQAHLAAALEADAEFWKEAAQCVAAHGEFLTRKK